MAVHRVMILAEIKAQSERLIWFVSATTQSTTTMKTWPNPDLRVKMERQVSALAASVIAGRAPVVHSTQRLQRLLFGLGVGREESFMQDLERISSSTLHLPLGAERQHWDPAALAGKDVEIANAEAWAREFGIDACRAIVKRFGAEKPPRDDESSRPG